eukprot:6166995-Amphidinium_carterae.1
MQRSPPEVLYIAAPATLVDSRHAGAAQRAQTPNMAISKASTRSMPKVAHLRCQTPDRPVHHATRFGRLATLLTCKRMTGRSRPWSSWQIGFADFHSMSLTKPLGLFQGCKPSTLTGHASEYSTPRSTQATRTWG